MHDGSAERREDGDDSQDSPREQFAWATFPLAVGYAPLQSLRHRTGGGEALGWIAVEGPFDDLDEVLSIIGDQR